MLAAVLNATNVKVVFRDFPLESIHPWAKSASMADQSGW